LQVEEAARRAAAGAAGGAGSARSIALVRHQQVAWREYRELVGRASRAGLRALSEADVSRFAALYRETSADLARARTYGGSPQLLFTLERLVGAGHNLLYRPDRHGLRQARRWVASGFPALVRCRWR